MKRVLSLVGLAVCLTVGSVAFAAVNDLDDDGTLDVDDNCWEISNPNQNDLDGDGAGDVCDIDRDSDGYTNDHEAVVGTNPDNWDTDGDNVRDSEDCVKTDPTKAVGSDCDITHIGNTPPPPIVVPDVSDDPFGDEDDDGQRNGIDNCPTVFNPGQQDVDGDKVGDACDNVIGRNVQVFFMKGGGGPGANCTLFAGEAAGSSLPLTTLLMISSLLMAIKKRRPRTILPPPR